MNGSGLLGSPTSTASFAPFGRNGGASIHLIVAAGHDSGRRQQRRRRVGLPVSSMTFHAPLIFFHVVRNLPFSVDGHAGSIVDGHERVGRRRCSRDRRTRRLRRASPSTSARSPAPSIIGAKVSRMALSPFIAGAAGQGERRVGREERHELVDVRRPTFAQSASTAMSAAFSCSTFTV